MIFCRGRYFLRSMGSIRARWEIIEICNLLLARCGGEGGCKYIYYHINNASRRGAGRGGLPRSRFDGDIKYVQSEMYPTTLVRAVWIPISTKRFLRPSHQLAGSSGLAVS